MLLNKPQVYCIGLVLLLSPFIGYKVYWLSHSEKVKGIVMGIREVYISRTYQKYPLIQFEADGYTVKVKGDYNLPYQAGDSIPMRYYKTDLLNTRYDSFWGLWLDTVMWCPILFIVWTAVMVRPDIIPKNALFEIKPFRVRILRNNQQADT